MLSNRACGINVRHGASGLWVPAYAGMTVVFSLFTHNADSA
jgi:hypothetical protein